MKELKEAVAFGVALGNALGASMEDGDLSYRDVINLWEPMRLASDAIEGASKIMGEAQALSEEGKQELVAYIKDQFDIPDDELEVKIEAGLTICLGIMQFISMVGTKKDA